MLRLWLTTFLGNFGLNFVIGLFCFSCDAANCLDYAFNFVDFVVMVFDFVYGNSVYLLYSGFERKLLLFLVHYYFYKFILCC